MADYARIPTKDAARALADKRRKEAVTRKNPVLADRLATLLEATAAEAKASGLTEEEIDAELAAYNAERRG
jgi:hypothetical protein